MGFRSPNWVFEVFRYASHVVVLVFALHLLILAPASAQENTQSASATTGEETIPFKHQAIPDRSIFSRIVLISIGAVGLIMAVSVGLKRALYKKGLVFVANDKRIKVLEVKRVAPKLTVFLLEVDGNDYLLAQCVDQIQLARHDRNRAVEFSHES